MGKVKIGNFKGPQGETGPQGPAGPRGPEGPQGPMGEVDANTQIIFTQATSRENIASGERLNIILGKIRKWFADIKGAAFQDVSNTLTTTEAGKVLDARQGKVLDEKVTEKVDKTDVVNGLTETAAGKVLDARQGKALDEKIDDLSREVSDLNSKLYEKIYEEDALSIADFYDVSAFDMRKTGNVVFLNVSLSLKSSAQFDANTLYTVNTNPISDDLKPSKTYHLQGFGCDNNWGQATAMAVIIEPDGKIKYTAPSRCAFFKISGCWFVDQ